MNSPRQIPRDQVPAGQSLCEYCTAKCCHYFTLPIERPRTRRDFEYLRWCLMHERASLFVEDQGWYMLVHTVCKHLQSDHRCGTYETRPIICREYTTDECEYEDDYTYDMYFETPEQLNEFAEARFCATPGADGFRTRQPGLPILQPAVCG